MYREDLTSAVVVLFPCWRFWRRPVPRRAMSDSVSTFVSAFSLDQDWWLPAPLRGRSAAMHLGEWLLISMLAVIAIRMLMAQ